MTEKKKSSVHQNALFYVVVVGKIMERCHGKISWIAWCGIIFY